MKHIKKNDTVMVIAGKDKGKSGRVLKVLPERSRAIVQGVNFHKKHRRRTRDDQQGGVAQIEGSIHMSNVMLICTKCNKPVRPKMKQLADGSKVKSCRKCGENL
ncbi:MAG: 50S ribosomal protein L24 [Candidatus Omnitrophica bacterium]|nr:50S ribosomal protein L24 [Candidatus Omnitrophota bacterium]